MKCILHEISLENKWMEKRGEGYEVNIMNMDGLNLVLCIWKELRNMLTCKAE